MKNSKRKFFKILTTFTGCLFLNLILATPSALGQEGEIVDPSPDSANTRRKNKLPQPEGETPDPFRDAPEFWGWGNIKDGKLTGWQHTTLGLVEVFYKPMGWIAYRQLRKFRALKLGTTPELMFKAKIKGIPELEDLFTKKEQILDLLKTPLDSSQITSKTGPLREILEEVNEDLAQKKKFFKPEYGEALQKKLNSFSALAAQDIGQVQKQLQDLNDAFEISTRKALKNLTDESRTLVSEILNDFHHELKDFPMDEAGFDAVLKQKILKRKEILKELKANKPTNRFTDLADIDDEIIKYSRLRGADLPLVEKSRLLGTGLIKEFGDFTASNPIKFSAKMKTALKKTGTGTLKFLKVAGSLFLFLDGLDRLQTYWLLDQDPTLSPVYTSFDAYLRNNNDKKTKRDLENLMEENPLPDDRAPKSLGKPQPLKNSKPVDLKKVGSKK